MSRKRITSSCSSLALDRFWTKWTFLGRSKQFQSFLRLSKTRGTKHFSLTDDCINPINQTRLPTELPTFDNFYSKPRTCNLFEADYDDYGIALKSGIFGEWAVIKLNLSTPSPTRVENYQYLQEIWNLEQNNSFKYSLHWYNNRNIVPIFGGNAKMIVFCHDKDVDIKKLGCTLLNLVYTSLKIRKLIFWRRHLLI